MVGEGGGVLEPDLVHLVRGGENAAERASAYLLLGVDGDLAVALQAATGVVRGTHLGALEVGGELVHSYGSDELHLAHVVVNRASAVARNGVGHDAVGDEVDFHRIDEFAAVKGGTSSEFFDDRTVIVVDTPN